MNYMLNYDVSPMNNNMVSNNIYVMIKKAELLKIGLLKLTGPVLQIRMLGFQLISLIPKR